MEIIATVKDIATAKRISKESAPEYFRVNASHMDAPSLASFTEEYSKDQTLAKIPLYIDLQGAKLRVDRSQHPIDLVAGRDVLLRDVSLATDADRSNGSVVLVSATVLGLIAPGTHVAIDDGKLALDVRSVDVSGGSAAAVVSVGGRLLPGKGFNLRPHPVTHTRLDARDIGIVEATKSHGFVRYALSFAALPEEVSELATLAGSKRQIAVKLERPLEEDLVVALGKAAGELWVCRGDMTVQLGGFGEMARYYGNFVRSTLPKLISVGCRTVMAGEVLDHMCECPAPTRSEVCHIADLKAHGFVGIVVSNETAVGKFPVEVIKTYREITKYL